MVRIAQVGCRIFTNGARKVQASCCKREKRTCDRMSGRNQEMHFCATIPRPGTGQTGKIATHVAFNAEEFFAA